MKKFVVFALAGLTACASAQTRSTSAQASDAITESDVRRILSTLAADSMEGRATGTPGANKAARFIASEMKALGLTPAGDTGYFQRVPFVSGGRRGVSLVESFDALAKLPEADRRIGYNMIGVIPGIDPVLKDQVVAFAAHYDALGIRTPVNGDSIVNGADDDASGVTTVLEIARAFASGPKPRRTILFIATTGEEQGILGTQWYVAHPA
ncbi:MAG TPA: M20/M25/M40 family metallo-hydrolase, partial [Gemmatimonadaceae bacterium]|nr:M20/M25/M40 family metallo-hydrolase [Gemmatimonadaceae bacterium]